MLILEFKKITVGDVAVFEKYKTAGEYSCENAFITQLIWNEFYKNSFAEENGILYVRSGVSGKEIYSLPFGDTEIGINRLRKEFGTGICFWAQEGPRLDRFSAAFGNQYIISEERNAADYIYSREALANLSGKKFHSKRNHISAFSKNHIWRYEKLSANNIRAVRNCAEAWYAENSNRSSDQLKAEKAGLELLLDNFESLPVCGGGIFCGKSAVAFTLGSPINKTTFDIHIEKALGDYSEAYTVINREFAKNELCAYEWINREDDMGLEGLRKAKQSYHPIRLLKKFNITPR